MKFISVLLALLPYVVYSSSEWFIFVMKSHGAHLNIYKVMETNETTQDSKDDLATASEYRLKAKHLPNMRHQSVSPKQDLASHVKNFTLEQSDIDRVMDEQEKLDEPQYKLV